MAHHKETYEGYAIEIEDDAKLTINGKDIDCEHDSTEDKWSSRYLPYTRYGSLLELARAIARHSVEFSGKKG